MTQPELVGPVENAVGYVLKEAAVALRAALDTVLRPLQLTVSQYACLELLGQRPGLSSARSSARSASARRLLEPAESTRAGRRDTRPFSRHHPRGLPEHQGREARALRCQAGSATQRIGSP